LPQCIGMAFRLASTGSLRRVQEKKLASFHTNLASDIGEPRAHTRTHTCAHTREHARGRTHRHAPNHAKDDAHRDRHPCTPTLAHLPALRTHTRARALSDTTAHAHTHTHWHAHPTHTSTYMHARGPRSGGRPHPIARTREGRPAPLVGFELRRSFVPLGPREQSPIGPKGGAIARASRRLPRRSVGRAAHEGRGVFAEDRGRAGASRGQYAPRACARVSIDLCVRVCACAWRARFLLVCAFGRVRLRVRACILNEAALCVAAARRDVTGR
jgi:hypothetical protein